MSEMRRAQVAARLSAVPQLGPKRIRALLTALRTENTPMELLLEYESIDLVELGMTETQAQAYLGADTYPLTQLMDNSEIRFTTFLDAGTPARLRNSPSSPWYFYFGSLDVLDQPTLGFSGARDASEEVIATTRAWAGMAAEQGWATVSGGARGVDHAAHTASLEHHGCTVIVLPQGLARWPMTADIAWENVLVMSEFLPFDDWGSYRAMQRNRSIVHLSDRFVIPQAGTTGGSWNAGEYALKQNLPVWVMDFNDRYDGSTKLIEAGAIPLNPSPLFGGCITEILSLPVAVDHSEPTGDEPSQISLF